ncbi:4-hydroxy-tetrahydrodipicolinate synthase [Rickettsiales endosymbiont of Peranema trichophorum]|uniref:4-hydroxy-tetrahydrodipicolinate synthase n=1 Tax=Rickettsiales endosymbiont of Peranema trichophorum TaxID=2486577 RepID=UPI001023650E|nr:4-hydroxy-tetrahydrodipicolinate synthase [Rickettsiales endosymbiont of Peranema trichophorum]RZI47802.1 4-hydroxy-tetrahydrodipicolinate synthase [Rickettsiales endosymbiont of Peranema trichophorum]
MFRGFRGLYTALATPFVDGKLDLKSFKRLIEFQMSGNVSGVVVLGSTGEAATLTVDERATLISTCMNVVKTHNPDVKVIVGTGSNSTATTLEYTNHAKMLGADAALVVCPYYNKPSDDGIYHHYKHINDNVDLPILVYNVPGRTVTDISNEVILRLSELKNVVGVKDATGNLSRPLLLKEQLEKRLTKIQKEFVQLSGEDDTAVIFNLSGGVGCISVTGNVVPKELATMQELSLEGKYDEAISMQMRFNELNKAMFIRSNPMPVKYALYKLGIISSPELRLPLLALADPYCAVVDKALKSLELI